MRADNGRTAGTDGYTNNGLNQVTAVNATGVTYDADGNLTSDGVKSYVYDAANRPVSTNGGTSTLSYDPLGRLGNMVGSVGGQYLYEGEALAGVALNGGTTVANRIIQGPWPDEIAVAYQGSGTSDPRWSLQDRLGSVVAITDGSAAVNVINAYDEYGRPQSGNGGRMQYTGQLWLPDFGVYHYKARQYHPGLGRFLQTDPIGYAAGANLYGYVAGDPVNLVDPWGLVQEPSVTLPSVVFTGTHCDSWNTVCNSYGLDWLLRGLDWNLGGYGGGGGGGRGHPQGPIAERVCAAINSSQGKALREEVEASARSGGHRNGFILNQLQLGLVAGYGANLAYGFAVELRDGRPVDSFIYATLAVSSGFNFDSGSGVYWSNVSPIGNSTVVSIDIGFGSAQLGQTSDGQFIVAVGLERGGGRAGGTIDDVFGERLDCDL